VGNNYLLRAAVSSNTSHPNSPDHIPNGIARIDANGNAPNGSNWLPDPEGEFYLILRLYAPNPAAFAAVPNMAKVGRFR
jgi:hypothetical protein